MILDGFISQLNNVTTFKGLFSWHHLINQICRMPVTINLLITDRCNLRCSICSTKETLDSGGELTTEQIKNFIKSLTSYKPVIFIGGGEPFIRDDIFDILEHIKIQDLKYGIVTNGLLLNEKKINYLFKKASPAVMTFSLYGPRQFHDQVTGLTGAFEQIETNIKFALSKKKRTKIILNCVINQNNYEHLEEVICFGKKLGVDQVRFEHLVFLSESEYLNHLNVCSKYLDKKESKLVTFISDINELSMGQYLKTTVPALSKKYHKFVVFKPFLKANELSRWYQNNFVCNRKCLFVKHSVFIRHNGDIIPCQFFSNYVLGNILNDDLLAVWRNQKKRKFNKILSQGLLPGCKRCCKL